MESSTPLEDLRHFPGLAVWVLGGLLVLLVAVGLYFGEAKAPAGAGVKVAEVTKNPKDFVGQTITVHGEVEDVLGRRAFILEDETRGAEMLVVESAPNAMPPPIELERIEHVRVVGEVRTFDAEKVQVDVGVPATNERLKKISGKPVLYAFEVFVPPARGEEEARSDAASN